MYDAYQAVFKNVFGSLPQEFRNLSFIIKLKRNGILFRQDLKEGVKTVEVPWERPNSGFTLLFEAFAMQLIMSVKEAAKLLDEKENRLWRALNYYVDKELEQKEFPRARIVVDKFHVMKILNEKLDTIRRREQ